MATRQFRSDDSVASEKRTRDCVAPVLRQHGFDIVADERVVRGTAITQLVRARLNTGDLIKMHVRLCWRREGRNKREDSYSAAQLRASLVDGEWNRTLAFVAERSALNGSTHTLFVQDGRSGIVLAALVPSEHIPSIWQRQREVSAELIRRGLAGSLRKNHAENGSSPTIWLQDDRWPTTHAVPDVLWQWPGVINVLALPTTSADEATADSIDDLPFDSVALGRDGSQKLRLLRSGYPRDAKVRAAVIVRSKGHCERPGCPETRDYGGFLDVHHIFGVGVSDRVWSCVALCPNCHREAHCAPERDAINAELREVAAKYADAD